jgi:catechol 2,3-dioxygenase-like lactoylglutathione lyase family enzyme
MDWRGPEDAARERVMIVGMHATKLVVRDVEASEHFYAGLGLKVVNRNTGGGGDVRQQQCWLSVTGDTSAHMLILSQFLEVPTSPLPDYPREYWLAFNVADVDAIARLAVAGGGRVRRPGEDRPEHGVRAAVIEDQDGHIIEIVGPIGAAGAVADLLSDRHKQDAPGGTS